MSESIKKHTRRIVGEWKGGEDIKTYWASLYIAGEINTIEVACRDACFPSGLCVTLEKVTYVFGGATEKGVRIGFIQYPPFPEKEDDIYKKAVALGKDIAEKCFQYSFTIVTENKTTFFSRVK
jgi:hypothetical protein